MIIQGSGALINIILDPILIFIFDMGVVGAAVATVIGQITGAFIGLFLVHSLREHFPITLRGQRLQPALLGEMDPRLMQLGLGLMKNCRERDARNAALLRALRPFLKEERRAGLDRALQIVGVTRIIRAALDTMGGKGEEGRV